MWGCNSPCPSQPVPIWHPHSRGDCCPTHVSSIILSTERYGNDERCWCSWDNVNSWCLCFQLFNRWWVTQGEYLTPPHPKFKKKSLELENLFCFFKFGEWVGLYKFLSVTWGGDGPPIFAFVVWSKYEEYFTDDCVPSALNDSILISFILFCEKKGVVGWMDWREVVPK